MGKGCRHAVGFAVSVRCRTAPRILRSSIASQTDVSAASVMVMRCTQDFVPEGLTFRKRPTRPGVR